MVEYDLKKLGIKTSLHLQKDTKVFCITHSIKMYTRVLQSFNTNAKMINVTEDTGKNFWYNFLSF